MGKSGVPESFSKRQSPSGIVISSIKYLIRQKACRARFLFKVSPLQGERYLPAFHEMGSNHVLLIMPAKIFCPRESRWAERHRGHFSQTDGVGILCSCVGFKSYWLRVGPVFRGLEFNSIIKGLKAGRQRNAQVFSPHGNLPFLRGKV